MSKFLNYKFWFIFIISASLILSISSFWNDSLIVDEIPHIGAGYSYLEKLDYRLNPEHPPLAKLLGAAPLLFLNLKHYVFQTKFWTTNTNGQWDFGRNLIFQTGNNADLITRMAKFPMLLFFILSTGMLWHWTSKRYGQKAGLIALILFSFSPTVMAHSRFVTTDLSALFGILFASYYFLKFLEEPNKKNLWINGIIFGIAQLTKFSLFLLVPYFFILAVISGGIQPNKILSAIGNRLKATIVIFLIGYMLIVWPVYAILTLNYPPQHQVHDTTVILGSFRPRILADTVTYLSDKPIIRGLAHYGLGLLMVTQRSSGGNTTYFLGEVSNSGWRSYFPIVYALKEPLAWWIIVVMTLVGFALSQQLSIINYQFSIKNTLRNWALEIKHWLREHFVEAAMLLWLVIYWATSIKSNLNIGVRHLMPTYPFAIMLVSGQVERLAAKLKIKNEKLKITNKNLKSFTFYFLLFTLLGWYVIENLRVWPYYLTYFNQLAGGPSGGYRYVVDSNLDWGQDLKRLAQWTDRNRIQKIYLDYFGWSDPAYYLGSKLLYLHAGQYKSAEDFLRQNPNGGYIAVSATFYMGSREHPDTNYVWLDNYKSLTVIGNSIFVWKF